MKRPSSQPPSPSEEELPNYVPARRKSDLRRVDDCESVELLDRNSPQLQSEEVDPAQEDQNSCSSSVAGTSRPLRLFSNFEVSPDGNVGPLGEKRRAARSAADLELAILRRKARSGNVTQAEVESAAESVAEPISKVSTNAGAVSTSTHPTAHRRERFEPPPSLCRRSPMPVSELTPKPRTWAQTKVDTVRGWVVWALSFLINILIFVRNELDAKRDGHFDDLDDARQLSRQLIVKLEAVRYTQT